MPVVPAAVPLGRVAPVAAALAVGATVAGPTVAAAGPEGAVEAAPAVGVGASGRRGAAADVGDGCADGVGLGAGVAVGLGLGVGGATIVKATDASLPGCLLPLPSATWAISLWAPGVAPLGGKASMVAPQSPLPGYGDGSRGTDAIGVLKALSQRSSTT